MTFDHGAPFHTLEQEGGKPWRKSEMQIKLAIESAVISDPFGKVPAISFSRPLFSSFLSIMKQLHSLKIKTIRKGKNSGKNYFVKGIGSVLLLPRLMPNSFLCVQEKLLL